MRVYADASIFCKVFDKGFSQQTSEKIFEQVEAGDFTLVTSELVEKDIVRSSKQVQDFYATVTRDVEFVELTGEVLALYQSYLNADLVPSNVSNGAIHFALASVSRCKFLVSWDYCDIVRPGKISQCNAINAARGYPDLRTSSPPMIIEYDDTIVEPMCVQWKRLGAAQIRKKLEGFTCAEELEYWRVRTEELRITQQEARKRLADQNA